MGGALVLARKVLTADAPIKPVRDRVSYASIDAYVEQQMRRLNVPGAALAIVAGDQIVHCRGFGRARPGGAAPCPQTPFFIGSLTKSFTALAVMQLVEAGQVELDAPVQRYLPWFRLADAQASAQVTVRHLLNQTSGLPQLSGLLPLADFDHRPGAGEHQARALSPLMLTRPVGAAWEYSNMNYNLLGLIVEAASGKAYSQYVQEKIFAPLDMSHTYTSLALAQQNGLAVGHEYWFAFPFAVSHLPVPRGSLPSGQLISSAEDMAHYLIAHLNGGAYGGAQILSSAGMAELHRPAVKASAMGLSWGQYAMGWFVEEMGHTLVQSHSGTVPDFFAYMALLPEHKTGVVVLVNANHLMMNAPLGEVGMGLAALLAGQQPAPSSSGLPPLGPARPAAYPTAPNRRGRRHAAAGEPLADGPGAAPQPGAAVGTAYSVAADPQPGVRSAPGLLAGAQNDRIHAALLARCFLDRFDRRRLRRTVGLPAHRFDPAGRAKTTGTTQLYWGGLAAGPAAGCHESAHHLVQFAARRSVRTGLPGRRSPAGRP